MSRLSLESAPSRCWYSGSPVNVTRYLNVCMNLFSFYIYSNSFCSCCVMRLTDYRQSSCIACVPFCVFFFTQTYPRAGFCSCSIGLRKKECFGPWIHVIPQTD